jgi:MFS family permease
VGKGYRLKYRGHLRMKNRKFIVLIIISISIIIGIFLGFYFIESGWPDRFYNGIKGIDWIMIAGIILMILCMTIIIISFLYNKKKAFEMIIKLYPLNYKMQSKRLILSLIILVFSIILVSYSLSISSICMFSLMAGNCVLVILPLYFTNGLYENGVMYSGIFYSWENIISYNYKEDNIIIFEIKSKFKMPLEVKFFFKSISCSEIDEILHRSI